MAGEPALPASQSTTTISRFFPALFLPPRPPPLLSLFLFFFSVCYTTGRSEAVSFQFSASMSAPADRARLSSEDDGALLAAATIDHEPFASPGPGLGRAASGRLVACVARGRPRASPQAACRAATSLASASPARCTARCCSTGAARSLRPALIWCDQRTAEECEWLNRTIGADRLLELTCNPALPNFTLTKLLWVREHEPGLWDRVRHVLLPKDYVRYCLSGEFATDVADASGTLMLDVATRQWSRRDARRRRHRRAPAAGRVRVARRCARGSRAGGRA